jgi:hypothetical protein
LPQPRFGFNTFQKKLSVNIKKGLSSEIYEGKKVLIERCLNKEKTPWFFFFKIYLAQKKLFSKTVSAVYEQKSWFFIKLAPEENTF